MRLRREQPVLITTAAQSRRADIQHRQGQYLFWMSFRIVCFVLAVVALHGWLRLAAVLAALVIPWAAVVIANGGPKPRRATPVRFSGQRKPAAEPRALRSGRHPVVDGDVTASGPAEGADGGPNGTWTAGPAGERPPVAGPRVPAPAAPPPPPSADVGFFGPRRAGRARHQG
ncbi:MAG: DUF3099 domain-containing protein [Frankia sp.]|nr:DUF3099 domain-containing protein [Frankia sp.]